MQLLDKIRAEYRGVISSMAGHQGMSRRMLEKRYAMFVWRQVRLVCGITLLFIIGVVFAAVVATEMLVGALILLPIVLVLLVVFRSCAKLLAEYIGVERKWYDLEPPWEKWYIRRRW